MLSPIESHVQHVASLSQCPLGQLRMALREPRCLYLGLRATPRVCRVRLWISKRLMLSMNLIADALLRTAFCNTTYGIGNLDTFYVSCLVCAVTPQLHFNETSVRATNIQIPLGSNKVSRTVVRCQRWRSYLVSRWQTKACVMMAQKRYV